MLLKSGRFRSPLGASMCGGLPYGVDLLEAPDCQLDYVDADLAACVPAARLRLQLDRLEQTLRASNRLRRCDVAMAMFESEGHLLATLRSLRVWPYTRPRFVVIGCWLSYLIESVYGPSKLRFLQQIYRSVDRVLVFSRNQVDFLGQRLGLPPGRVVFVPFGVDHRYFRPEGIEHEGDYVLAVGRDRGRDWRTFLAATRGLGAPVKLVCRPSDIRGLEVPPNVSLLGPVGREEYRRLLARARCVVVPTRQVPYPSGQTVLLESMAMGKACVVTSTPALADYLHPEQTATLTVPPESPEDLRSAMRSVLEDGSLRSTLGAAARRQVDTMFNVAHMWASVRDVLWGLTAERSSDHGASATAPADARGGRSGTQP